MPVTNEAASQGFPPIVSADARLLILGTLPSRQSLAAGQYYAHPRNAFWPIIAELCQLPPEADYATRKSAILARRIALWDVCHQAVRPGSNDSDIDVNSIVVNDFPRFFYDHPGIAALLFNGQPAARLWRRCVLPNLAVRWRELPITVLPSTSPANARQGFLAKLGSWREALENFASPGLFIDW